MYAIWRQHSSAIRKASAIRQQQEDMYKHHIFLPSCLGGKANSGTAVKNKLSDTEFNTVYSLHERMQRDKELSDRGVKERINNAAIYYTWKSAILIQRLFNSEFPDLMNPNLGLGL